MRPLSLSSLSLRRPPGSNKEVKRVGRGIGSGLGSTAGRGQKGQKSRTGSRRGLYSFEGGQTEFWRRIPKSGFSNKSFELDLSVVNVGKIQTWIDRGILSPHEGPITIRKMWETGCISKHVGDGVKLLAEGELKQPVAIEVTRASKAAIEKVEKAGGSLTTVWMNRLGLRAHMMPQKFREGLLPRQARPPPKYQPYYTSDEHRGYLSSLKQRER